VQELERLIGRTIVLRRVLRDKESDQSHGSALRRTSQLVTAGHHRAVPTLSKKEHTGVWIDDVGPKI
jgi:hypothetical protein